MRYVGQVHECTVEIGNFEINAETIAAVKEAFHRRHEELYTYSERHNAVEAVNIESTAFRPDGKAAKPPKIGRGAARDKALKGYRKADLLRDRQSAHAPRSTMAPGSARAPQSKGQQSSRK